MSTAPSPAAVLSHEDAREVVERKGFGHPDTLSDGIAELASIRYAEYCLSNFGVVLHHNLDKVAVLGGRVRFGDADGHYERPVRVMFGGRASSSFAGQPIPVAEILTNAAYEQLRAALPGYDQTLIDVRIETTDTSKFPHWFTPRGLHDLPEHNRVWCNDTAYLVGAAPYTAAELTALLTEAWLADRPWSGSDIKALVTRYQHQLRVTACVPALAGTVATTTEFRDLVIDAEKSLTTLISDLLSEGTGREYDVDVRCNTQQNAENARKPLRHQYFTVSGSAVDYGEDGMVGRGNSRHGLISASHGAGNEATYGKNPVYHVGKVGAWLADRAADAVYRAVGPCRIGLVWHNSATYDDPASIDITTSGTHADDAELRGIVRSCLAEQHWLEDLVAGQRYLPRIAPVDELISALRAAR